MESIHQVLHEQIKRNSDRDFPRTTNRVPLTKPARTTAEEKRGNLFLLLCLLHTTSAKRDVYPTMMSSGFDPCKMIQWNHKDEVRLAKPYIANVIDMIHIAFPRRTGNGWGITKSHGFARMPDSIRSWGTGLNFFGGPGEASHKTTVKKTGLNTQKRFGSFASQSSKRYFENLLIDYATTVNDLHECAQFDDVGVDDGDLPDVSVEGVVRISFGARFERGGRRSRRIHGGQSPFGESLFGMIERYVANCLQWEEAFEINAFTSCKLAVNGRYERFRVTNQYMGGEWRDFCTVQVEDGNIYPALILGFFQFATEGLVDPEIEEENEGDSIFVAVQTATEWKDFHFLKQ
ncbi:hypothetical protein THAOC_12684, partial [Thalassiosira oceanica]